MPSAEFLKIIAVHTCFFHKIEDTSVGNEIDDALSHLWDPKRRRPLAVSVGFPRSFEQTDFDADRQTQGSGS